ncbi:DUF397 domain-containing protein [Streptomyces prunicolor]|uniref:DUF397 domain-containing protein n=1 Tax=Streptomyces prunicolor TaxID=67348 RepID=UPI0033C9D749
MPTHLITSELAPDQAWFKSSYSDPGQNCVEAAHLAPEQAWFKSSYSDAGQNCIEAARLTPTGIAVRDSKNPTGPALLLPAASWTPFLTHIQQR